MLALCPFQFQFNPNIILFFVNIYRYDDDDDDDEMEKKNIWQLKLEKLKSSPRAYSFLEETKKKK
jgi:hypothetical protein